MIRKIINPILFALIFIGVGARIYGLGSNGLSEMEAALAIGVVNPTASLTPIVSGLYQNVTAGLFFLFESTSFLARLPIASAGIFLVFSPFLFKKQFGSDGVLVWAALVAVSPLGVSASREINTMTLTMAMAVLAVWSVLNQRKIFFGFTCGALLFAGPEFWLISLLGAGFWLMDKGQISDSAFGKNAKDLFQNTDQRAGLFIGFAAAFFVFGIGVLQNSLSISSVFHSLTVLVGSFTSPKPENIFAGLTMILFYEPLLLALWIITLVIKKPSQTSSRALSMIVFVFMAAIILRQGSLLALSAISYLVAFGISGSISDLLDTELDFPKESAIMALFTLVILIFAGINVFSSLTPGLESGQFSARLTIAFFSILLLAISAVLVAAGWTRQIAVFGTAIGLLIFATILNASTFWKASGLYAQPTFELWQIADPEINSSAFSKPIERINKLNHRTEKDTVVEIVGVRSDALLWALRNYDTRSISDMKLSEGETPFVVTGKNFDLEAMQGDYRGQNIMWSKVLVKEELQPISFFRWMIFRQAPLMNGQLVLWTNSAQFIDQQNVEPE